MKINDLLGKAVDGFSGALLLALILIPPLYLQATVMETFRVPQELFIVTVGWGFILLVALKRALSGLPLWGGGAGSKSRRFLALFLVWLLISSAIGYSGASPWGYAMSVITFLLVGQSVLDWTEADLNRRRLVFVGIAALVSVQTIIGLAEWLKAPLGVWSQTIPTIEADDGTILLGWWPHDILNVLSFPAKEGTPVGTLGNANFLGEFLALTFPVLVGFALTLKKAWVKSVTGLLAFVTLFVLIAAGTRAAILGLVLAGVFAAWVTFGSRHLDLRQWWSHPRGKLVLGLVSLVMIGIIGVAGNTLIHKLTPTDGPETSISSRLVHWRSALGIWAEHPIAGTGLGGFKVLNVKELMEQHPDGLPTSTNRVRFQQAHNEPVQAMAELGLVGLGLLLLAFICWVQEVRSNPTLVPIRRFGLIWGASGLLLTGLAGFPFHIPVTAFIFLLIVGMGIAQERPQAELLGGSWRAVYALVASLMIGFIGLQAFEKGVWPLFQAHQFEFAGKHLRNKDRPREAEVVYSLAFRYDRYKGDHAYYMLNMMATRNEWDRILTNYDLAVQQGLGMEGLYWKARALQGKGKTVEAVAAYNEIIQFFGKKTPNGERAARRLSEMASDLLAKKDKSGVELIIKAAPDTP